MKFIDKIVEKLNQKEESKKIKALAVCEDLREVVKHDHELLIKNMCNKICPLLNDNCIAEKCVHFNTGRIDIIVTHEYNEYVTVNHSISPHCLLWNLKK